MKLIMIKVIFEVLLVPYWASLQSTCTRRLSSLACGGEGGGGRSQPLYLSFSCVMRSLEFGVGTFAYKLY